MAATKPHIKYSEKTHRHTYTHAHIQNKAQQAWWYSPSYFYKFMIKAMKQNCQFEESLLCQNQEEGSWRGRPEINLPCLKL